MTIRVLTRAAIHVLRQLPAIWRSSRTREGQEQYTAEVEARRNERNATYPSLRQEG